MPPAVLARAPQRRATPGGLLGARSVPYGQVASATLHRRLRGHQGTRPQTIGYSLADTPVGLAAWLLDHDATTLRAPRPALRRTALRRLTRDDVLDNTSLYWFTNTAMSAARLYWQQADRQPHRSTSPKTVEISVPAA